ncbi:nuclear transport factor 2 family protein [Sphingomonas koreensis]|nr:nuclear transport factor 2 family protein [Sphingomonas koreensis]
MTLAATAPLEREPEGLSGQALDRLEIRELVENWVVWRDSGDWERFSTVWHPDGRMNATWFRAAASEFIEGCRRSFDGGLVGIHMLGGSSIELNSERAVVQTKMQIVQRADVRGAPVDVTCMGRFVDAIERHQGRWSILLRQPVYELDRLTPLEAGVSVNLDKTILDRFPLGYRHLAYVQTLQGFAVNEALPGTRGPEVEALFNRMRTWLHGGPRTELFGEEQ